MSSFLGHALTGIAIAGRNSGNTGSYQNAGQKSAWPRPVAGAFCALLAISPDLDYVILWVFGYGTSPRLTHSLGYCFMISSLALMLVRSAIIPQLQGISKVTLYLIPLSHLLLDYLVGVHKNPFFWPLSSHIFTCPVGILPSAGKIALSNMYFWRNLTIEMAILLPVAFYTYTRCQVQRLPWCIHPLLGSSLIIGIWVGLHLSR